MQYNFSCYYIIQIANFYYLPTNLDLRASSSRIAVSANTQNIVRLKAKLPGSMVKGSPRAAFTNAARVQATPIPVNISQCVIYFMLSIQIIVSHVPLIVSRLLIASQS